MRLPKLLSWPASTDEEPFTTETAEALLANLRRAVALHAEAAKLIDDAEATLDHALESCPALDEADGDGTLLTLRNIA